MVDNTENSVSIAYLGPSGTYTEAAALACTQWVQTVFQRRSMLCPYPSIAQALKATVTGQTQLAVVPVENSIEGGVTFTLDTLWQLDTLQVQQAIVLPIAHALLSRSPSANQLQTIYSHPQALAQCQGWLERHLPSVKLVPTNSTTEAVQQVIESQTSGAIAPHRAAQLYDMPILAYPINDHPDNCTRFWILGLRSSTQGQYSSLAFSLPANTPGALAKVLQVFAQRNINLSRIESRPTKRSLGEYLFFIDIEAAVEAESVQSALDELENCTETLKIFGSYTILPIAGNSAG